MSRRAPGANPTPPVRLDVRLLGGAEVVLDGYRLAAFGSLRLQRFLALLAVRGGPQHRARLAFELWPDSSEKQARTNLRKLLHDLRHALPDMEEFVEVDAESIRWIQESESEVDVIRFRDAAAAGHLELAARLYTGEFLPACYDDWVLEERARLRGEAHRALMQLTREAAEADDHQGAVRHAQRVLDLEPTDESAARAQIEAYLALGDRAAALRTYHRLAEVLERDLGVGPSGAIEALYPRLRGGPTTTGRTGRELAGDRSDTAMPAADSPLVGRSEETRLLAEAWTAARGGTAHVLVITGEPGIGKTRLAAELASHVRAKGHAVASARAYEAAGRPPWGPIVEVLRSQALQTRVEALDPVWKAEIARLLPEIDADSEPPHPMGTSDPTQRHRLFDAVSRAITSRGHPLLLIIDDLQWCDAETIEVLGFLVRSRPTSPVLVVGTARWGEVPDDHPVVRLMDALDRDRAVSKLALDRLDEPTTARLAAQLTDEASMDPDVATRLWHETEGNPLFVIEAVRAGVPNQAASVLTPTMKAVLAARLNQLTAGARKVADVAAIIGRAFPVGLLADVMEEAVEALVDDLDELWRRRIIRDQGTTYDFSHDKLRAVALAMVPPARRRQLHGAVARAIENQFRGNIDSAAPLLAAHFDQAGMVSPAIAAYQVAGGRAVSVSALEEAVSMFQRALALLADLTPSRDRDALELDLRVALGSPLAALEGYGSRQVHRLYDRALNLCRRLDRPTNPPILRGLGLARLQGCRFSDCNDMGQALIEQHEDDVVAHTEGQYLLGVSAFWQGNLTRARHYLSGATKTYEVGRRQDHLALYAQDPKAVCLVRLALIELWEGDAEGADATARAALGAAADIDHPMTLGYVLTYAAILASEAEDLPRLEELLAEAARLWPRLSERYLVLVLDALRGSLAVRAGDAAGIDDILEAVAKSRIEGETLHLTYTLLLLARARALTGEFREGRTATKEALAWTQQRDQRYLEAELWRLDGELAYRCAEAETARTSLQTAADVARAQGAAWLELQALISHMNLFPDPYVQERLRAVMKGIAAGYHLRPFETATGLMSPPA